MRGPSHYLRLLHWMLHNRLPCHDVTVDTLNGRLTVSSKDWLIGKHLFTRRNYEVDFVRHSVEFLRSNGFLKEGTNRIVADVGANLGMIGIALAREGYFERVLAFEPEAENFRLLRKNVEQNQLSSRIECFQIVLSSTDGEAEFEIAVGNSGDGRVRLNDSMGDLGESRRKTVKIRALTFDTFLNDLWSGDPADIDLLWIDIQGHEGHFFSGAREFFNSRKVPVVSEFWPYGIDRSGVSEEEYCKILAGMFSEFYLFTEKGFSSRSRPINEIARLFDGSGDYHKIYSLILI